MDLVNVRTRDGLLRGHCREGGFAFLGIPYAAPPVGPLRWRPPQPVAPWDGVRDALAFGPDFPQQPGNPRFRAPRQAEDCLYLNVWTPTLDANARLPVLVWFHGGGFQLGSGSDAGCDGARLAREGAVVVTFNYRCGLFGFLAHRALGRESEDGTSGNYGLRDQLAALRWVQENIAAFGGDAEAVAAMGVSAGGASIVLLLQSPAADGLFHRAILHSPGCGRPLAALREAEQAGSALGHDLAALRALPASEVLARTPLLVPAMRSLTRPRVLRPIVDGVLLREDEPAALQQGRFRALPLIAGTVLDEGSWLTRQWPVRTLAAWQDLLGAEFGSRGGEASALYPAGSDAEVPAALAALFADTQFHRGTRLLLAANAAREPRSWKFLFTRRRPGQADGPHHSGEVGYAFGNPEPDFEAADHALSDAMRAAWLRFAAGGEPGLPGWERYRAASDQHLVLDAEPRPGAHWRQAQLDFLGESSRPRKDPP